MVELRKRKTPINTVPPESLKANPAVKSSTSTQRGVKKAKKPEPKYEFWPTRGDTRKDLVTKLENAFEEILRLRDIEKMHLRTIEDLMEAKNEYKGLWLRS